ncbi:MAG: hypothetical protein R2880_04220 [Deinococcales bacterium]
MRVRNLRLLHLTQLIAVKILFYFIFGHRIQLSKKYDLARVNVALPEYNDECWRGGRWRGSLWIILEDVLLKNRFTEFKG